MKHLKKLAILILLAIKTTPLIILAYKEIYNNIIKNDELINKKVKDLYIAHCDINTTLTRQKDKYDVPEEKIQKVERLRKRQRQIVNANWNRKFKKEDKCQ